ncbi:hypothetical protein NXF25_016146, partial [Crotalus adamanteus]
AASRSAALWLLLSLPVYGGPGEAGSCGGLRHVGDIQNIDKGRLGSKSSAFTFTQRCSLQQSPLLPTAPPAPGQLSAIGSDLRNQPVSRPPPASACALGIDGREKLLNYSSHHPQREPAGARLTAPEMPAAGSLRRQRPGQTRGPEAAAR